MAITITSTSDSQEAVNAAAGLKTVAEPEQKLAAETEVEHSEAEQAETELESETGKESEQKEETEGEKPVKGKGGFQKKIDKLTREKYELTELVDKQSRDLAEALKRLEGKPSAHDDKKSTDDPKPKEVDFETYEEFVESLAGWKYRQEAQNQAEQAKKAEQAETQKAEQDRLKEVFDNYNANVAQAREELDDFDEVLNRTDIKITQAVQLAVVESGDPKLAYHLGKHPELLEKLNQLPDMAAVLEVGRIAASLAKPSTESKTAPIKPPSKAPAPIKPVGGSATKTTKSLSDPNLSQQEYMRLRRAGHTT